MKNIPAVLILAVLFAPYRAAAQGVNTKLKPEPGTLDLGFKLKKPTAPRSELGKWWKNSEVAKELEITPAQNAQIEQKFLEYRLQLIDLRAELEKQETLLEPMMEEDRPDESKVGAQIDGVLAARGRLEKANAMMMLSIRRVLTTEQWHKLEAMHIHTFVYSPKPRVDAAPAAPPRPSSPPAPPTPPGEPDFE